MTPEKSPKKKHLFHLDLGRGETERPREDERPDTPKGKRLRRVVKLGEKGVKHGSEMLEKDEFSEKDLAITMEVVTGVSRGPEQTEHMPAQHMTPTFACLDCGAIIPVGSVRCPACNILYVDDPSGDGAGGDSNLEREESLEWDTVLKDKSMAFVHFDVDTGNVTCLEMGQEESDFGLECHNCGAVTVFATSKCPLCGHSFDDDDTGLVMLLEGLKFDLDGDTEMDCPSCGEHVVVDGQRCPSCKEVINPPTSHNEAAGVLTLLKERNVVFVHLDIARGDLYFASRTKAKEAPVQQRVHLDSIGNLNLDNEWKGLARV